MSGDSITISTRALARVAVGVAAVILVLLVASLALQQRDRLDLGGILARGAGDRIDRSTYQAVFLTGGQAYFGQLSTYGDAFYLLRDVYYLGGNEPPTGQPPGQLVKRGRELHGPQDEMVIPAQSVLFIENLRLDGDVMIAIRRFKSGDLPPATPAPAATPTATPRASPTR